MFSFDEKIFYFFFYLSRQHPWIDFLIVSLAEFLPYIFIAVVLFLSYEMWMRKKKIVAEGYFLALLSGGLATLVAKLIQYISHNQRPFVKYELEPLFTEISYSFPSAHAMGTFALSMGVYLVNKRLGVALFILSAFVSLARVMAGVHYPSDIIFGGLLGAGLGYGINRFVKRMVWKNK